MADASVRPVTVDRRAGTITLPYHAGLAKLVPAQKSNDGQLVVPHTHDVVRLARNLGLKAPAPITVQYDWNKGTPFKTQRITAAMLTMNPRAYVLSEMGTGKTRATLYAIDFLKLTSCIEKALIVAPLSTLTTVWWREIFQYFNHLSVGILYGDRKKRLDVLSRDHDIYVVNHDGVHSLLSALRARTDIDCVVVDELAVYRNGNTVRWKDANQLVQGRKYVWGLTGSPTPNEPVDAWAQVKLLTPERVPKYRKQFMERTMMQVSTFRWIPRSDAKEHVYSVMQPAVRFTRDDCVELPPVVHMTREVELSAEQNKVYRTMVAHMKAGFAQGEVTAVNEGVLMSKLLQIAAGSVYTRRRDVVELDNSSRIDALAELIDEAEGKVIVFADFIHVAKRVSDKLKALGYHVAQVSGDTPKRERDSIFTAFQSAEFPRVLVAHPLCMAHGLTLTSANVIIWYTPTTSLETYEQACARITRPGQTRKQLIVHLTGTAIESKLYKRLQQKASLQGALLEMFE